MVYIVCCIHGLPMSSSDSTLTTVIERIGTRLVSVYHRSGRSPNLEGAIASLTRAGQSLVPDPFDRSTQQVDHAALAAHIGLANLELLAHITDALTPE